MRFPFPPVEPVSAASLADAESTPLENASIDEFASVTAAASESQVSSIGPAAPHSRELTAECAIAEDPRGTPSGGATNGPDPVSGLDPVVADAVVESAPPAAEKQAEADLPGRPRPKPKRKVIAFPRQPRAVENVHQLADPVLPEQPRILDVPEELEAYPTTPFLEGLQFEPAMQVSTPTADRVELPFRSASILQRLYAAVVDCSLVLIAAAIIGLIAHKMLPDLTLTKPTRLTAALVPLLLWVIFQYLLLIYAGRTAGMRVAGLRLHTFSGGRPTLRHARSRVMGLYLSTASLGMGLLWAFVDGDSLCWHDRISGTYLIRHE